jgi:hypothetical protein
LDAYRQYLEERLANGDFTIHEKVFEKGFWHYFNDDYTDKSLLNYSFTMGCQLAFTLRGILERFNWQLRVFGSTGRCNTCVIIFLPLFQILVARMSII